ncbi:Bax inhibitor-1/YccA family protein [Nocardioidaceae bacterium]|nr:Bax inhibitor-1/YccA family protein [Nocardioidaceae bacterium]
MQSSNPVFSRSEGFNGRGGGTSYAQPSSWSVGNPGQTQGGYGAPAGYEQYAPQQPPGSGRMTIDSVVQKSAATIGTVIVVAALTWMFVGDLTTNPASPEAERGLALAVTLSAVGSIGAFVLSLVNSFKKKVSPALVLAFSVLEGVFVGAFSKVIDATVAQGVVLPAVLGTFAAAIGTLAAYKLFNIQVGDRFRSWVIGAMFGFVGLAVLSLVLSIFGVDTGLFGFGALGLLMSVVGLALGVFMLILDFDFVERGIAAGLPEVESWRAAFGLTVSLVWIYINLLRILAILNQE